MPKILLLCKIIFGKIFLFFFAKILHFMLQFLKEFLPLRASFAAYAAAPRGHDAPSIVTAVRLSLLSNCTECDGKATNAVAVASKLL